MYLFKFIYLLIPLCIMFLAGNICGQNKTVIQNQCFTSNQLVKKTLDPENVLYWAIEENKTGTGENSPWMTKLKRAEVKQVTAEISFEVKRESVNLTLKNIDFFSNYYDFGSKRQFKTVSEIAEKQSLEEKLKTSFFVKALNVLDVLQIIDNRCGTLYLNVLDDSCLPVFNDIPSVNECAKK